MVIQIDVLNERAMNVIRYLEEVKDVVLIASESEAADEGEQPRKSWIGAVENPSQALLDYADNVRGEWDHRI